MTSWRHRGRSAKSMSFQGFSRDSAVKNLPAMEEPWEMWVRPLVWKDPLEEDMATHSSTLAGESHGQRSLEATVHRSHKESDTTEAT